MRAKWDVSPLGVVVSLADARVRDVLGGVMPHTDARVCSLVDFADSSSQMEKMDSPSELRLEVSPQLVVDAMMKRAIVVKGSEFSVHGVMGHPEPDTAPLHFLVLLVIPTCTTSTTLSQTTSTGRRCSTIQHTSTHATPPSFLLVQLLDV